MPKNRLLSSKKKILRSIKEKKVYSIHLRIVFLVLCQNFIKIECHNQKLASDDRVTELHNDTMTQWLNYSQTIVKKVLDLQTKNGKDIQNQQEKCNKMI